MNRDKRFMLLGAAFFLIFIMAVSAGLRRSWEPSKPTPTGTEQTTTAPIGD